MLMNTLYFHCLISDIGSAGNAGACKQKYDLASALLSTCDMNIAVLDQAVQSHGVSRKYVDFEMVKIANSTLLIT